MFGVKMTNENKAMLKFDEVVLDWATLSKIPKAQLAFLSMLMMASNEINSLLRAYSVQDHDTEAGTPTQSISTGSKLFFARMLSQKLFEVIALIKGKDAWNKTNDELLVRLRTPALKQFEIIATKEGHQIAQVRRDNCSSHYSLAAAKKNIDHVNPESDFTLYIEQSEGNSYYCMGDSIGFSGNFTTSRLPVKNVNNHELLGIWLDWTTDVLSWLRQISAEYAYEILPKQAWENAKLHQVYWVDPKLVGVIGIAKAPIFLRNPRN